MNKTSIEWVRNPDGTQGYTHNPFTGCKYHTPEGLCLGGGFPCYAYRLANGRLKQRYLANKNVAPYQSEDDYMRHRLDPFYPRFWAERLGELDARNRFIHDINQAPTQRGIFVCDMSDLFGIGIPEQWTNDVLNTIDLNDGYDRFYLLTKQSQNLIKWSPFPDNCWVGVTATNSSAFDHALYRLSYITARFKYLSIEPYLTKILHYGIPGLLKWAGINWVIIGAQTKPYKPPKIEWVEEIVRACDKAVIPVFLKDNLRAILPERAPFYFQCSPTEVYLRQEMPK